MKFIKYSLILLTVACFLNFLCAYAYPDIYGTVLIRDLVRNEGQYTGIFTKHTISKQTYETYETYTSLTNPCPNCQVAVTLHNMNGDASGAVLAKIGAVKDLITVGTSTGIPGDYRLYLKRLDFTALNTHHTAHWVINADT